MLQHDVIKHPTARAHATRGYPVTFNAQCYAALSKSVHNINVIATVGIKYVVKRNDMTS